MLWSPDSIGQGVGRVSHDSYQQRHLLGVQELCSRAVGHLIVEKSLPEAVSSSKFLLIFSNWPCVFSPGPTID